jgi:Concanavalin A-like lectin/glucanases superfamily
MTALWLDGFDHYGTLTSNANMLAGPYAIVNNYSCGTPSWGARTGTFCAQPNGFAPSGMRRVLATTGTHYFVSFGVSTPNLANDGSHIISFMDNSATEIAWLTRTPTGALQFTTASGGLLATTSGPVMVAENWHFFEMEADFGAHTFTLRVDDATASNAPVMSVSHSSITGTIGNISFGWAGSGASQEYFDDIFIRDNTGSTNNGWLGDRRIATLLVDADTSTAGWTPLFYQELGAGILNNTAIGSQNSAAWASGISAQNVGSGDFTIEGFVRFQALPTGSNKAVIFSKWDETDNLREYQLFLGSQSLNNGSLCFQTSTDGTVSTVQQPIVYPWTPNLNTWYHIAVVRASSQDLLFVNGQQLGLPQADSRTYFAATAAVFATGAQVENHSNPVIGGTNLQGWFDEVRLTVGNARYTSNFTPPTVEFPRGVSDPQWLNVAFLAGYDSNIQDESSHATTMAASGAFQQTVHDGASVGSYSTLNKSTPDDNTYMTAPFLAATSILTLNSNPANGNTVTVGTKDGTTPAVYTFKTALASAFDVLIDTNVQNTLQNLFNAINAGAGSGTKYGAGTTSNFDVFATQLPAGQMMVTANAAGTGGNAIATSSSGVSGGWTGSDLAGGTNIPGPSNFKLQRLPPTTTLVSAVQLSMRAFKSDSGLGSVNSAFIGALGGTSVGPTHSLTVSPVYYNDIYQIDPDTSGPISPTTLTNGAIQINRDV